MDWELFLRIREGDQAAFKELYIQHVDKALRVATGITRNKEQAKDAVQETFIRVYRYIDQYDLSKPFEPWFYRILTNECMRLLQKEARTSTFDPSELEYEANYEEKESEDFSHLYQAIQSLHDMYRIPILLKYIKGFSEKEIAQVLELKQNTVKSRLFQGREKLRRILDLMKRRENHV
ncbi:RNA polymerase sigma factor [Niallia sp. Krafla_26]|uniref:RNA polymerase sigma factor n=1 Tax=Niallia sp. Krafla_26 TaxID=3064703 RepID=UPI003D16B861